MSGIYNVFKLGTVHTLKLEDFHYIEGIPSLKNVYRLDLVDYHNLGDISELNSVSYLSLDCCSGIK